MVLFLMKSTISFTSNYNSFKHRKKCGISMNIMRNKFTDCLKEFQKLPKGLGLLFEKTYLRGMRVDCFFGFCIMGLTAFYTWR